MSILNKPTNHDDIIEFATTFDVQPVWRDGMAIDQKVIALRKSLIQEEVVKELLPALDRFSNFPSLENLTDVADGLVDSVYVILGAVVALDLPWQELWDEVQRSNMAKVHSDGSVRRRDDGKILKPEGWKSPDLFKIIMHWHTERCLSQHEELRYQYSASELRTKLTSSSSEDTKAVD